MSSGGALRPPSRIDSLSFPLFAVDWFAEVIEDEAGAGGNSSHEKDPSSRQIHSWVAYCGGGGSARTGVKNNIVVFHNDNLPIQISTGDQAGGAVKIYQNPQSKRMWMLVALGRTVRRYSLVPYQVTFMGEIDVGEKCEVLAVSPKADQFAIGVGEDGRFKVYAMTEAGFATPDTELHVCSSHSKALTSMAYSPRGNRIISAARDGKACIWEEGKLVAELSCAISEAKPAGKPGAKARPQQVLVRGCAFGDMDGKVAITVHSGRKSEAYLSRWQQTPKLNFIMTEHVMCSTLPATALSLSLDQKLLTIGVADGAVILWNAQEWKLIKRFNGVHELPVTCIAARPIQSYRMVGEDTVTVHVRTGSLDCNTGILSLDRAPPKKKQPRLDDERGPNWCAMCMHLIHWSFVLYLIVLALNSMYPTAKENCMRDYTYNGWESGVLCIWEEVFYLSPSQMNVPVPPV